MKFHFIYIIICLMSMGTNAQEWHTDISVAKTLASERHVPIILVFQGSDWCAPCIKLDREIWSSDIFKAYAADHFVMLKADFPKKKANALSPEQQLKNKALAEQFNKKGYFPYVVVLDEKGMVLGSTGYSKVNPEQYIEILESLIP